MNENLSQKMKITFSQSTEDEVVFHDQDLIQIKPLGLSFTHDLQKPFLLFRDLENKKTFAVGISPIEAGIFISQNQQSSLIKKTGPHLFLAEIMSLFDVQIKRCVFVQIQPEAQYVRLYLTGHPMVSSLKFKAEDVMSVCLHLEVPIFVTQDMIRKSISLISQEVGPSAKLDENLVKIHINQRYLM